MSQKNTKELFFQRSIVHKDFDIGIFKSIDYRATPARAYEIHVYKRTKAGEYVTKFEDEALD